MNHGDTVREKNYSQPFRLLTTVNVYFGGRPMGEYAVIIPRDGEEKLKFVPVSTLIPYVAET